MMNSIFMSPQDRLLDWKNFRDKIDILSKEDQLISVAKYWASVPIVTYCLDIDAKDKWPTPWELIHDGYFCKPGLGYLMYKTLELTKSKKCSKENMRLALVNDLKNEETYIVVIVDNQHVLNYDHGSLAKWEEVEKILEIICEY